MGQDSDFDLHIDNDVPDGDGSVALVRSTGGHVAFLPRSLQGLRGDALDVVAQIQEQVTAVQAATAALGELVPAARSLGLSWDAIGWCVGTTGRAASMRWGGK